MVGRFEKFSYAISEISRCWHKLAAEEMVKHGLKGPHATYLTAIYKYSDGITVPELCELTGKDKSDASRMLTILEEKGLIKKVSVKGSLYRGLLLLTPEGKLAAEKVVKKASLAVEIAGKDLTDDMRDVFYKSLDSITANLLRLAKEGIPD